LAYFCEFKEEEDGLEEIMEKADESGYKAEITEEESSLKGSLESILKIK
jgi:hypothetical protein